MPIKQYPATEPLYILTCLDSKNAHAKLRAWIKSNGQHTKIESNKIKLYTINSLQQFLVTWKHGLHDIKVWDCWNKSPIYLI